MVALLALAGALGASARVAATDGAEGWLARALAARALTHEGFAGTEVFSWTSATQAAALAEGQALLSARADDGATRGPYQRALDELAIAPDPEDAALARVLTGHPALSARRYAWTTPYGTVLPRGRRSYGPVLLRIELDGDAWHARFAPGERPAFRVRDGAGREVPRAAVLAAPHCLATVLHVRPDDPHGGYREIVVHGAVARWSMGTPEIAARLADDQRVLAALARGLRSTRAPSMPAAWSAPLGADLATRFAQTMPFDTSRHRPTAPALAALARAMASRARQRVPATVRESADGCGPFVGHADAHSAQ